MRPKILVLRGVFEVFSLGMNDLAQKLRCRGYDAEVTSWTLALPQIECSIRARSSLWDTASAAGCVPGRR